ncbi:hypothetical protein [Dactylosporangium sp. CA-092794]|uniref:hypothetical protein n=1 Tax=Dactylosporangium sp. CA-092794 TaxID=3239929 RepID=UPI003D92C619
MIRIATASALAAAVLGWLLWPSSAPATELTVGSADRVVTVAVATPRVGDRDVEVRVTDRTGRADDAGPVEVTAVLPTMGFCAAPAPATPLGGGRFRAARVPLMSPGDWQLRVDAGGATHVLPLTVLP